MTRIICRLFDDKMMCRTPINTLWHCALRSNRPGAETAGRLAWGVVVGAAVFFLGGFAFYLNYNDMQPPLLVLIVFVILCFIWPSLLGVGESVRLAISPNTDHDLQGH